MNLPETEVLRQLIELVETNALGELTVEDGGSAITVRRQPPASAPASFSGSAAQPVGGPVPAEATLAAPETQKNLVHVTSPIIGIFYRSPDPNADPYVEVDTVVEEGSVVGLVEAMKVFNEIVADVRGRVVEIPATNEQLVSRGETLAIIDPLG